MDGTLAEDSLLKAAGKNFEAWKASDAPMLYVGDIGSHSIMWLRGDDVLFMSKKNKVTGTIVDPQSLSTLLTRNIIAESQTLYGYRMTLAMVKHIASAYPKTIPSTPGDSAHTGIG